MRKPKKIKLIPLFALMLIMSAFLFSGTAYAADNNLLANEILGAVVETLTVDDVWLTGETLHIIVTDKNNGETQKLELNLLDYAQPYDEYVSVQAADSGGRISNTIQFKNPFYVPKESAMADNFDDIIESAIPDGKKTADGVRPFTPDGTGTVVDNVTDGDGKEFFSIKTEDSNVFYLIVDRQRTTDNVYLLNAVTEQDLMSLAKSGDGKNVSAVPDVSTITPVTPEPAAVEATSAPAKSGGDNSMMILVVVIVIAVGGAGYYFKIVRPKQSGGAYEDDAEEFDDNEELEVADDGEEVENE